MRWNDDILVIKGIGEKTAINYRRIGINTVGNLLMHIPRGYDEFGDIVPIRDASPGSVVIVTGVIAARAYTRKVRNMTIVSVRLRDGADSISLVWFNMPFMASKLRVGTYYIVRGKVSVKNGVKEIVQPKLLTKEEYYNNRYKLMPIYPLTGGLTNNAVAKACRQAISEITDITDYLPERIISKYNIMPYQKAVKTIHLPDSRDDAGKARKRFVFDEFFLFLLMLKRMKSENSHILTQRNYTECKECDMFIKELPYRLTDAQVKVWNEVRYDMLSGHVMNRLIQGDVGSGKTVIAALSLLLNALNGYQGVLMVPTEVLARQHYESLSAMCSGYGVDISLLTGSMSAAEKKTVYELIRDNKTNIIIGTHALIQEKVKYAELGLVITDEQHRFGVNQRKSIVEKGSECHTIVMSATPIPRTLSMILYGDMDVSVIDEVPKKRLPIMNCVVGQSYRSAAYAFILKEIRNGHKAYIVCPMIDDNEESGLENVTDYYLRLSEIMPPDIHIDILHGRMKPKQKDEIMDRFRAGDTDILISTTVIEVGIDVPSATVMLIENAERFGLAQLHQLRGRVGRSDIRSYCIFMTADESPQIMQRLNVLNKSNDGFYIASQDLKLRGPGDMFGVRQSGEAYFDIADIYNDADVLFNAHEAADHLTDAEADAIYDYIIEERGSKNINNIVDIM